MLHGLNASDAVSECSATREKQRRSADNDQRTNRQEQSIE